LLPLAISNRHSSGLCAVSEQKIFFLKNVLVVLIII